MTSNCPAWPAALALLLALPAGAERRRAGEARREARVGFAVDLPYLEAGAVQYFYELLPPGADASTSEALRALLPLDADGAWARRAEPLSVMLSRVAFVVEKDVAFFSRARVTDPTYMNTILEGFGVRALPGGRYRTEKAPACTFTLDYLAGPAARAGPIPLALAALDPGRGPPQVVVVQHNFDFERVMGARTSQGSYTATAHYGYAPGRTLVVSATFGLVVNTPPFFLGGAERLHREARKAALELIRNLQAYPAE